ncbi:TIGR04372 family glycosyltransferase [uncultured Nisaea sp.]|uniref:TIGR04372 family glycosyltransferase n=1 Tax=uncultured Nisaea sp. TaxID=538215 RepID=UPI0030EB9E13|tara:strand:+ start:2542 stop:3810 length:1269 start_codon:yes stop_codon:yes gene_type:complete
MEVSSAPLLLTEEELRNVFAPEHVTRLIQSLAPYLAQKGRTALYILPLAWRIGHFAMEPHAFWELYGEGHNRLVILTPDKASAQLSLGVRSILENFVDLVETTDTAFRRMGQVGAGIMRSNQLTWNQRGTTGLIDDYIKALMRPGRRPRHFPISQEVTNATNNFLEALGISSTDRIIVLNVRDLNFLPELTVHGFRAADIATYKPAVEHLIEEGYKVLRIGVDDSIPLDLKHPHYREVWKEPGYSTLLDPGLIARADFGITCSSGPEAVFRVLGVPQLQVNGVLQCGMWMNERDKLLFKTYRKIDGHRIASYRELLDAHVAARRATAEALGECGYYIEDNTADEILAAVMEMQQALSNEHAGDLTARKRFLEIGENYHAVLAAGGEPVDPTSISARQTQYGYALPWTQLADSYLETHPDFLE